jgi:23S rRNA-/tRNA-specific pseudouridylate synthase
VRARRERHLLVEAEPLTGRTHQVRAHLGGSGAPLWGDEAYGGPAAPDLGLHAWWLVLPLPGRPAPLRLLAPPPPAFAAAWGEPLAELAPAAERWTGR